MYRASTPARGRRYYGYFHRPVRLDGAALDWRGQDSLNDAQRQAAMIVTRDQTRLLCPNYLGGERPGKMLSLSTSYYKLTHFITNPVWITNSGSSVATRLLLLSASPWIRSYQCRSIVRGRDGGEGPLYKYAGLPGFSYPRPGQTDSLRWCRHILVHPCLHRVYQAGLPTAQSPEGFTGPLTSTPHKSGRITCTRHSTSIASYSKQRSHQT